MNPSVYEDWPAASVLLPTGEQWHRVRAYATDIGLLIFKATTPMPDWQSPIDFTRTHRPRRGLLHVGIDIHTEAGLVVVTPTGGCWSCGGGLKHWTPPGLHTVKPWPTP